MTEQINLLYARGSGTDFVWMRMGHGNTLRSKRFILESLKLDSIIRISADEYPPDYRSVVGKEVVQFGLRIPYGTDIVGNRAILPRIVVGGHYNHTSKIELLPVLDFKNALIGTIILSVPAINYEKINPVLFSLITIGNILSIADLRTSMVTKYSKSTSYGPDEILSEPVSIRQIRIDGILSDADHRRLMQ